MSSTWLHNHKVEVSFVNVEGKDYLVYTRKVGSLTPVIVEDVDTGKRIKYTEIKDELPERNIHQKLDTLVHLMIQKLK